MPVPPAPTDVVAAVPPGYWPAVSTCTLTWADNTGGTCQHRIYRRHTGTNGPPEPNHVLVETAPGVTSYTDGGLVPQNVYTYYVVAFSVDGESDRPLPLTVDEVAARVKPKDAG